MDNASFCVPYDPFNNLCAFISMLRAQPRDPEMEVPLVFEEVGHMDNPGQVRFRYLACVVAVHHSTAVLLVVGQVVAEGERNPAEAQVAGMDSRTALEDILDVQVASEAVDEDIAWDRTLVDKLPGADLDPESQVGQAGQSLRDEGVHRLLELETSRAEDAIDSQRVVTCMVEM